MLSYLLELLGATMDPIVGWLADGGFLALLTLIITQGITKNRKERWKMEGKEEDMESLIISIINLKNIVMGMLDMFVLVFAESKGIDTAIKEQMFAKLEVMRQEYGAKIDAKILEALALAKAMKKKTLEKTKEAIEKTKGEATSIIDQLANKANEIVQKELNKD